MKKLLLIPILLILFTTVQAQNRINLTASAYTKDTGEQLTYSPVFLGLIIHADTIYFGGLKEDSRAFLVESKTDAGYEQKYSCRDVIFYYNSKYKTARVEDKREGVRYVLYGIKEVEM